MSDPNWSDRALLLSFDGTNGATSFSDASSQSQTVTFFGSAALDNTRSKWGTTSLRIDGTSGCRVEISDAASLEIGASQFCIEGWVWLTPPGGEDADPYTIFAHDYNTSSGTPGLRLYLDPNTFNLVGVIDADGLNVTVETTLLAAMPTGQWVHFVFFRDSDNRFKIGFDGDAQGDAVTLTRIVEDRSGDWSIGASLNDANRGDFWLSDLRFTIGSSPYSTPNGGSNTYTVPTAAFQTGGVTAPDVVAEFASPVGSAEVVATSDTVVVDPNFSDRISLQHFDGSFFQVRSEVVLTQYGTLETSDVQSKFGGESALTGTAGAYQEGDGFDWVSDFTLECFIYVPVLVGNSAVIADTRTSASENQGFRLTVGNTGLLSLWYYVSSTGFPLTASTSITAGTWHHVRMVKNGTTVSVALDGTEEITRTGAWQLSNTEGRFFQDYEATATRMTMYVDELRISQRAEPSDGFTPPTSAFPDSDSLIASVETRTQLSSPVGTLAANASFYSALVQFSSPLARFSGVVRNNFTALLDSPVERYVMRVTGNPFLEVKVSSWQGTLQVDRDDYLQCVVPNYPQYANTIASRQGTEEFVIYRYSEINGVRVESEMARAPLTTVAINSGAFRSTATISGYNTGSQSVVSANTVQLSNVRQTYQTVGGAKRIRSDIDWFLRPGESVEGGGVSLTADYISYFVTSSGDSYMDVGSRGSG